MAQRNRRKTNNQARMQPAAPVPPSPQHSISEKGWGALPPVAESQDDLADVPRYPSVEELVQQESAEQIEEDDTEEENPQALADLDQAELEYAGSAREQYDVAMGNRPTLDTNLLITIEPYVRHLLQEHVASGQADTLAQSVSQYIQATLHPWVAEVDRRVTTLERQILKLL